MSVMVEHWRIRNHLRLYAVAVICTAVSARIMVAWWTVPFGNPEWVVGLGIEVILPALLAISMLSTTPSPTSEGALLRAGTALHMLFILGIPPFALHLALGLPCVFLVVELVYNYAPQRLGLPLRNGLLVRSLE